VWAPGVPRPIVRGGRYDHLLGRYGAAAPATGFAIDLDALETALRESEARGDEDGAPIHVVAVAVGAPASARVRAAQLAAQARARGARAWVDPDLGWEQADAHARRMGAQELSFVDVDGKIRHARIAGEHDAASSTQEPL